MTDKPVDPRLSLGVLMPARRAGVDVLVPARVVGIIGANYVWLRTVKGETLYMYRLPLTDLS